MVYELYENSETSIQYKINEIKISLNLNQAWERIKLLGTDPSPEKAQHEWQVSHDHYPVTVCIKQKITLVTWNVRTLSNCGQLENVKQEISRLNDNILGVYETR